MSAASTPSTVELLQAEIRPLRHPWRWISAGAITIALAILSWTLITNERFQWDVVWSYLFADPILAGVALTLQLTVICTALALVIGTILALMRGSANPVLRWVSAGYIWFFRSVPLLVQLIFLYNISALFPEFRLQIPFGPTIFEGSANTFITPMVAAILALTLNESAYTAETVRGGILSVSSGQLEAGKALGFNQRRVVRHIILPQALKVFIPPFGNQVVNLLKMTSLVSVIALSDLLYSAQIIYSRTFETVPLLVVASLWYLLLVSVMSYGQSLLEQRLKNDRRTHQSPRRTFAGVRS